MDREGEYVEWVSVILHTVEIKKNMDTNFLAFPFCKFGLCSCSFLVHPL